jgi:GH24 family phage-related lysozyme (muramidase)
MRQVVEATFPTWSAHFEGELHFFYLDVKRLVTVGVGNLVEPYSPGLDFGGAREAEIRAAWLAVKNDQTLDPRRGGTQYGALTSIRMTEAGISSLVRRKMLADEAVLKTFLPNWEAAPAQAQRATLSHSWAYGPYFPPKWPKWTACFNAGDYAGAAVQDAPSAAEMAVQNASFHARVAAEQALLATCLSVDPDYLSPDA